MSTYDNCAYCKKGLECGWSNIDPRKKSSFSRNLMTNEPCENYCQPSTFTAKDLTNDVVINLMVAMVDNARDDMAAAIRKKRIAEEKIRALRKVIDAEELNIKTAAFFLPRKARIIAGKAAEEGYKKMGCNHHITRAEYLSKLNARLCQLEADVLDLSAERRAILDSLISCVTSISAAPGGASDPHAYDEYAAVSAELEAKINEIVDLRAKIKRLENLKVTN